MLSVPVDIAAKNRLSAEVHRETVRFYLGYRLEMSGSRIRVLGFVLLKRIQDPQQSP